jgi:hypothetical protein
MGYPCRSVFPVNARKSRWGRMSAEAFLRPPFDAGEEVRWMHGNGSSIFTAGLDEHVGWHIFFWRTQPSDYLNTGRHMQAFQKHKTTECRKSGVQARRALSKWMAGGVGKGHVWKPARSLRQQPGPPCCHDAVAHNLKLPVRLRDRLRAMLRQKSGQF